MGRSFSSLFSSSPSTKKTISSKSLSRNSGTVDPQTYQAEDSSVTFSKLMENTKYRDLMDCSGSYEIYINRKGLHWYLLIQLENSRFQFVTLEITTSDMKILLACVCTLDDDAGKEYIKTEMTTMKELCDVADDVKKKMGSYHLYSSNCQHFCNNILKWLNYPIYNTTIGPNTTLREIDLGFDEVTNVAQWLPSRVGRVVAGALSEAGVLRR